MKNLVNSLVFHLVIFLPRTIWKTLLQKGLVTGLVIFYFVAPLDEVIYSPNIILQQKDFCISVP